MRAHSLLVVSAGLVACGARTGLPSGSAGEGGGAGGGVTVAAPCKLQVGVPMTRVFPDTEATSEVIVGSHLTATSDPTTQCFLGLSRSVGAATFSVDQRCMHAFGGSAIDFGAHVVMGAPMDDSSVIPPADLFVAKSATSGFAMYYRLHANAVFSAAVAPGSTTMPTAPVSVPGSIAALGATDAEGTFALVAKSGSETLAAAHLQADGTLALGSDLVCATNNGLARAVARVGKSDIVATAFDGGSLPDCTPVPNSRGIQLRSTAPGSTLVVAPLTGFTSTLAITPFGANEAFVVVVENTGASDRLRAFRLSEKAEIEATYDVGPVEAGFGISAAELGGALLVVGDAPHTPGNMDTSGLRARLVDPASGAVMTTLDVPLPSPGVDSPEAPTIVTSPDGTEALLGFFVQPVGTGGRDFIARLDCKP